jgi:L-amino acid N-acyltransferase YncA
VDSPGASHVITAGLADDDRDVDQILALNLAEYGPMSPTPSTDAVATRAEFDWRRDRNPAGRAVIPIIRNAQGEVSGFIWLIPLRVRIQGHDYEGATGANLVIAPASRGTLGLVKLLRRFNQAVDDSHIAVHFSFVAEAVYQRLRAENPASAFTVPLLVKPLDVASLSTVYATSAWQREIGRRSAWISSAVFFRTPLLNRAEDLQIETLEQFDETFDGFWDRVRDRYPASVIRDRQFLTWRFAPIGERRYHILVARAKGDMLAYAVIRCARVRGVDTGLILDFVMCDGTEGEEAGRRLVDHAEAFFREQKMWLMTSLIAPGTAEHRVLRSSGCRNLSFVSPRRFRFALFVHDPHRQELASLSVKDWFISFADFESL